MDLVSNSPYDWYVLKLNSDKKSKVSEKHDILYHIGNNCMTMFRKIPLYPKLISFGDNA